MSRPTREEVAALMGVTLPTGNPLTPNDNQTRFNVFVVVVEDDPRTMARLARHVVRVEDIAFGLIERDAIKCAGDATDAAMHRIADR